MPPGRARDARALWYVGPGQAELRPALVAPPAPGEALVRTQWSGISRGTERLVWNGLQGSTHRDRMRAPMQEGDFPFPVKYGYCAVGRIEEGPDALLGRTVFCLHPHQDLFVAPADALALVPEGVPARRATLAANMETALNALWDSGAGPGDRIVIVGAGVVGLLLAMLTARLPGAEVTVADVVFHTSGSAAGLATALRCCGLEAALVEMSWYGDADIAAPLGGEFHSRRIRLLSSQVGQVSPTRRPRWSHARRLAKALELLGDGRLDALVKEEVAFARLPAALPRILGPEADGLAPVVRYAPEHASLTVDLPPI